jgi:TonB family protein
MRDRLKTFSVLAVLLFIMFVEVVYSQEVISARRLYNYSFDNEFAFDKRYKGKTIRVQGEVHAIEKDMLGDYYILLEGDVLDDVCVQLYFSSSNAHQLSGIDIEDVVLVEGRCAGRGMVHQVEIRSCRILKHVSQAELARAEAERSRAASAEARRRAELEREAEARRREVAAREAELEAERERVELERKREAERKQREAAEAERLRKWEADRPAREAAQAAEAKRREEEAKRQAEVERQRLAASVWEVIPQFLVTAVGDRPTPPYRPDKEGRVTINVRINSRGVVTGASIGANSFDSRLGESALESARRTKFNYKAGGKRSDGALVYNFGISSTRQREAESMASRWTASQKSSSVVSVSKGSPVKPVPSIAGVVRGTYDLPGGGSLVGKLARPQYSGGQEGQVVVKIVVSPSGEIKKATIDTKNTTLTDRTILENTLVAARQSRFTSASKRSEGMIIYTFSR